MDFNIIIIGVLLIAVCAIPFVITSNTRRKQEKVLFNQLNQLVTNTSAKLNHHELNGVYAIGIDINKKVSFFYRKVNESASNAIINLQDVKHFDWLKTEKKNAVSAMSSIEKLQLKISYKNASKPDDYLTFFDLNDGISLSDEFISLKKWEKLLNETLSTNI